MVFIENKFKKAIWNPHFGMGIQICEVERERLIMELIDYIIDLGINIVKDKCNDYISEIQIRDRLKKYIQDNKNTLEELGDVHNLDYANIINYICRDLINEVRDYITSKPSELTLKRQKIINKAINFSRGKTKLSEAAVTKMTIKAIGIVYSFYRSEVNEDLRLIAAEINLNTQAEIKDLQEEINEKFKEHEAYFIEIRQILDAIQNEIHDTKNRFGAASSQNLSFVERVYKRLLEYYDFIVDRVCVLARGSRVFEFTILIQLQESFKDILIIHSDDIHPMIKDYFYRALSDIAEYLHGDKIDFTFIVNMQMKRRVLHIIMDDFAQKGYYRDYDFWDFIEKNSDKFDRDCQEDVIACVRLLEKEQSKPVSADEYFLQLPIC